MTRNKSFKGRVRARMDKTGERYATARRQLVAKATATGEPEAQPAPAAQGPGAQAPAPSPAGASATGFKPPYSDEVIRSNTGRSWDEWFALLDRWGRWSGPTRRSRGGSTRSTTFPAGGPRA